MKRIAIEKWTVKTPTGEDAEEDTIMLLTVLISSKDPKELPKGLDNFRLFNRISNAFEKAAKTSILELEEGDYTFIKKTIENDIPSTWGMNHDVNRVIDSFMNAKSE